MAARVHIITGNRNERHQGSRNDSGHRQRQGYPCEHLGWVGVQVRASFKQANVQSLQRGVKRQGHERNEVVGQAKDHHEIGADQVLIGGQNSPRLQGGDNQGFVGKHLLPGESAQQERNKERKNKKTATMEETRKEKGRTSIFQYTLEVKPEFKNQYSVTDLRTIQDWVVKRQLSGIKGVVEINTWGGYLKQYEIAINPTSLKAMNISTADIFTALEKNNSIAGGSYIEKTNQSYFIRGEGKVNSVEDIENIVVKNDSGLPIYIKDIAKVQFGFANRFGAITGNGEGEKVLGQVMMLKGGNSKQVIDDVKSRVVEIEKTLPQGIYINGFLERSELVGKTSFTVAENLILGCLIVIFVVVLLLGNWRSGLVVASVIPLCLLFAISFMNIFGIDANLMSLGAIDFGIIIDGAVIIVEFIAFQIANKSRHLVELPKAEQQIQIE